MHALSKWALEEEKRFHIYANTLGYTFRLIRQPKPDWDEALEELYRIARMPMNISIEEQGEKESGKN